MFRPLVFAALALMAGPSFARTSADPCRTKNRPMTLAKNCYSGDMAKTQSVSSKFFASTVGHTPGVSYCYNSFVQVDHKPGQGQFRIRVMKESHDGKLHAYQYTLATGELNKAKKGGTLITLKGPKGECFSATGDREACNGGILKAIGLKDMNSPMILGLNKSGRTYTITHLAQDPKEISSHKPKELNGVMLQDTAPLIAKLVQDVRRKLSAQASVKMAAVRAGRTTPKKLSETSEQFRYCTMALEGYVKAQKLSEPFTPQEKSTLDSLISYMNNDPNFATVSRLPATSTPVVTKHKR